jgi:2-haloacid dehalogenase
VKYKFLLFDADGTLLDFAKSEAEALREMLSNNGIRNDDATVELYSGINDSLWKLLEKGEIDKQTLLVRRFELLLEALSIEGDPVLMAREYEDKLSTKGYVLEGVEEMCQALYGRAKMYIVTNGLEKVQKGRYAVCGIDKYFENAFISDVIGFQKPSVHYFEYVAKNIKDFDKSSTLIIGDSLSSDIKGGLNFGIDTCWYNPKGAKAPEDMGITFVAKSFDEVLNFIINNGEV